MIFFLSFAILLLSVDDNYANEGEDDFQATEAAEADNVSNAGDAQLPQDVSMIYNLILPSCVIFI